MDKNPVQAMLAKEMSRRDFLAHIGAMLLTVIGVSGFIKAFTAPVKRESGYGSSSYGGDRGAGKTFFTGSKR